MAKSEKTAGAGRWRWLIVSCLLLGAPLSAQTPPVQQPLASASKESFIIEPSGIATGAKDAYLRFIANSPAGFAASSSKQPEIKFGEGVTLVTGSFRMLNGNEAECKVNVDADAMGAVDVNIVFYSVNGTTVFSTQRATLGLLGPTTTGGIKVSVESVNLVRVNVTDAQSAGVIVLSGIVNGSVSVICPTGVRFSAMPVATTTKGTINTPGLAESNTQFNFSVGNAAAEDTVVRITQVSYDTSVFSLTGGSLGILSCEVKGAALSNQNTLVANAHTALSTIAGSNDNTDVQPSVNNGSNSGNSSTPTTNNVPAGTNTNVSTPRDDSNPNPRQPRINDNNRNPGRVNTPSANSAPDNQPTERQPNAPQPPQPVYNPPPPPPRNDPPAAPKPVANPGGSSTATDGRANWVKDETGKTAKEPAPEIKPVLITTPGLYFCDKDFKPLDMLVLNALVSDKAGARVWIAVKLNQDKNADTVDTIDVTLKVSGTVRTLKLTETGKNTGEFRCDKAGVLLVSDEDPDSIVSDDKPSAPKARPGTYK